MTDTPDIKALIAKMDTFLGTFPKGTTLYSLHPAVMVREARDALERQQAVVEAAEKIGAVGWQRAGLSQHKVEVYFETAKEAQTFGEAIDVLRCAIVKDNKALAALDAPLDEGDG